MYLNKKCFLALGYVLLFFSKSIAQTNNGQAINLKMLLDGIQSNYEFLKGGENLIKASQANVKDVAMQRLPSLKTDYEVNLGSDNSLAGSYYTYGIVPTVNGGIRSTNTLRPESGTVAVAGLEWQVTNFGGFQSNLKLAQSQVDVRKNQYLKNVYGVSSIASNLYLELTQQYQLIQIQQDNVNRLQQLKNSIDALVNSGVKPGVDSTIAASELSKAKVFTLVAEKNFTQLQQKLGNVSGITSNEIVPDTISSERLITEGLLWTLSSPVDSLTHPEINYATSLLNLSQSQMKADKNAYYPKLMFNTSVWSRGSSISNTDSYSNLSAGLVPDRFNYLAAISFTYDLFNIAHKRLRLNTDKYEVQAQTHLLNTEKENLKAAIAEATVEKNFEFNRLSETEKQLNASLTAYNQQVSLYKNGLSSFIDVNTTLNYYIQARRDYLDSKIGLMRSILDYALLTNSFNSLVQTLKP